jgi:hypothetical protein
MLDYRRYRLLVPANHPQAILLADIKAKVATVTSIAVCPELSVVQLFCSEVTYPGHSPLVEMLASTS